ncbi:MAG: hypothetical protein ABIR15_16900 [Chitinophagaceae bacterium]
MKKARLTVLFIGSLLLLTRPGFAQHSRLDSLFAKGDTTAVMDSLMMGFDAFLDSLSQPKSFFSASAGMGNRTFSIKNNSLNTQEATTRQLSFTPALAYYHKSGLGISATGFIANLGNSFHFYQYAVTPSYDYISSKISTGISYTRYFGKDTATLNASPYDNDLYAYFNIHRKSWRYGIAVGYATGNFKDKLSYPDSVYRYINLLQRFEWVHIRKTIESTNHIKDFSLSASVRKDFEWYAVFTKKDNITASVTAYLVTGASKIKTSTNINYATKRLTLAKFKRSYDSAGGNDFEVQSAALSASIFYTIGKFNVQPIWFMDYYFQDTDQKFSQVFSLTFAYNF